MRTTKIRSFSIDGVLANQLDDYVRSAGTNLSYELRLMISDKLKYQAKDNVIFRNSVGWKRYNVHLPPDIYDAVRTVANNIGMKPTRWTAMLVRRWLSNNAEVRPEVEDKLDGIQSQLKRIGNNINQIAHAANIMRNNGNPNYSELLRQVSKLPSMVDEVKAVTSLVAEALQSENKYWLVGGAEGLINYQPEGGQRADYE